MREPAAPVLVKWYIDGVDPDGRSAVIYWSEFSWRGIRASVHNLALHTPGLPARAWSRFSRAPEPEVRSGHLLWRADGVDWSIQGQALGPPFGLRLFERDEGSVDWQCEACPMRVEITLPEGGSLSGLGYAERVTLGLAPWRLPIEALRWGRWIADSGERSMVWIDWRGTHPLTAVFVDATRRDPALVCDDRVEAGRSVLELLGERTMYDRSVRDVVGGTGPLAKVIPGNWLDMEDRKWLGRGQLVTAGAPPALGWVIREVVRFP